MAFGDEGVEIDEVAFKLAGEFLRDGCFAGSHEAQDDDALIHIVTAARPLGRAHR